MATNYADVLRTYMKTVAEHPDQSDFQYQQAVISAQFAIATELSRIADALEKAFGNKEAINDVINS